MPTKIRFCENNKGKGGVIRRLEETFPDLDIKIKKCVKQCGSCREQPMAVLDKVKITAASGDELYEKIHARLKKDA